jgi:hypothetical protein
MTELRLHRRGLDWREIEGEVIALDSERSRYLAANPAGTLLWRALAQGSSEDRLAELLVETYDVEPARARRDVSGFVAGLREQGLLEAG